MLDTAAGRGPGTGREAFALWLPETGHSVSRERGSWTPRTASPSQHSFVRLLACQMGLEADERLRMLDGSTWEDPGN